MKVQNETLATEVIKEMQDKMNCILTGCECLIIDLEKAQFIISQLFEIVNEKSKSELEALHLDNEQHKICFYTDIALDYVSRVKNSIEDLTIRARK